MNNESGSIGRACYFIFVVIGGTFVLVSFADQCARDRQAKTARALAEISARAEIADATTGTTTTSSTTTTTNIPGSQWSYSSTVDKMDDSTSSFASVDSSNILEFDFPYRGPQRATLTLRNMRKSGKGVVLQVERGQFSCYSECSVVARIDGGKPVTYSAGSAANGRSDVIFLHNYASFIKLIKGKSLLLIKADFYQQSSPVLEFDVSGLDESKLK